MFREIINAVYDAKNVLLFTHINPDGDALGSCYALKKGLKSIGKRVEIVLENPAPSAFSIFGEEFLTPENLPDIDYDLKISLDCADRKRLGRTIELFHGRTINIDHHISNNIGADINLVDASASAVGEIIYDLMNEMGICISKEIANGIYGAIMTDTGGFMFQNTTAKAHRIAAELIDCGADYYTLNKELYQEKEFRKHLIMAKCIEGMEFYCDDKICISVMDNEMCLNMGINSDDLNGISSLPRSVKGVEAGVLMTELVKGRIKISLRTDILLDASEVLAVFGGGGHERAAGATTEGELNTVKNELLAVIKEKLESKEG